jgi:hypothetical protein
MRNYLLLATCLSLAGCGRHAESQREVLAKLESIKSELTTKRGNVVRWAVANKREIDSAIFQWSRSKMEEARKSEALSPEIEEKIRRYETLQAELMHKRMDAMRMRLPPRLGAPEASTPDREYETLSNRVAEARAPIADIVDRRNREASQQRDQYSTDKLIAEYVKDRFDLVVDSSDESLARSAVLYRTDAEVLNITDGIIKLFKGKTKP